MNCLWILQPTETQLSYPFKSLHILWYLHIKATGIDTETQSVVEWKINDHKHSLWENQHKRGCTFTAQGEVAELQCQRLLVWRTRMSYWSVTFIYSNKLFMRVSVLLRGFAKSDAVGNANTTDLFHAEVWNIKWSFNYGCVQLSMILTALKIQGRGWNRGKQRAETLQILDWSRRGTILPAETKFVNY